MRSNRRLPALLVAAMTVACGGEPPAEQVETQPAPETAAAPAAPSCFLSGTTPDEARGRPSPLSETAFSVGGHQGILCYGAPSARTRKIMGGLVPFGELWRLGANEATALHLTGPAQIGGVELQRGSYSLYVIPGETEWTFFLNSAYERWGIPIDEAVRATEVGSFRAVPEAMETPVEKLTFRFEASADGTMGDLVMEWENTRVKVHLHPAAAGA